MTSLILHVGPPKCGSTTIQEFFILQKKPCVQKIRFMMLNPSEISELNREEPDEQILSSFTRRIADNTVGHDVLILSHEYLYECRYAVANICNLAKNLVADIRIVGFSRRQSEFLISEYSQWGFRLPNRVREISIVLKENDLDTVLFSGLEQRLIASIIEDFYVTGYGKYRLMDWYHYYEEIRHLTCKSGAIIKCGALPRRGSGNNLVADFCEKSGLTLMDKMNYASQQVRNTSFHPEIIEAINNAIVFGLDMPGIHESNDILELFSSKMVKMESASSEFMSCLKSYIDTNFLGSNQKYCQEYGISETYFLPSKQLGKREILDLIAEEYRQRTLNAEVVINNYRMLSARMIELCFQLMKDGGNVQ